MKWGIWVIGDDMGRGDPRGHWYRTSPTSMARGFDSKAKAERHKLFMDDTAENCSRECVHSVEEFEDEHTKPGGSPETSDRDVLRKPRKDRSTTKLLDNKPRIWKKGM